MHVCSDRPMQEEPASAHHEASALHTPPAYGCIRAYAPQPNSPERQLLCILHHRSLRARQCARSHTRERSERLPRACMLPSERGSTLIRSRHQSHKTALTPREGVGIHIFRSAFAVVFVVFLLP